MKARTEAKNKYHWAFNICKTLILYFISTETPNKTPY